MLSKLLNGLSNMAKSASSGSSIKQSSSPSIADYQKQYKEAAARGDADAMKRANEGANAIRQSQGQSAQYATNHINSVRNQQTSKPTVSKPSPSPSYSISDYQNQYREAASRGDSNAMKAANDGANAIRRQQGEMEQYATSHINSVKNQQWSSAIQPPSQPSAPPMLPSSNDNKYGSYIDTSQRTSVLDAINRRVMGNDDRSYSIIDNQVVPWSTKQEAIDRMSENMEKLGDKYWNNSEVGSFWETSAIQRYGLSRDEINALKSKYGINTDETPFVWRTNGGETANLLGDSYVPGRLGSSPEELVNAIMQQNPGRNIQDAIGEDDNAPLMYKQAQELAKRYGMHGYDASEYLPPMFYNGLEAKAYGALEKTPEQIQRSAMELTSILNNKINGGTSNNVPPQMNNFQQPQQNLNSFNNSNPTGGDSFVPIDKSNPSAGGIYKNGGKFFIEYEGNKMELNEDEYIQVMSEILGF